MTKIFLDIPAPRLTPRFTFYDHARTYLILRSSQAFGSGLRRHARAQLLGAARYSVTMDKSADKPQLNEDVDDTPEIESPELDPPAPGRLMVKQAPPPRAAAEVAASHRLGSPGGRVFNLVLPTVSTATS